MPDLMCSMPLTGYAGDKYPWLGHGMGLGLIPSDSNRFLSKANVYQKVFTLIEIAAQNANIGVINSLQ